MTIDVENLYGRRADNRWDRMAVGDMLDRMAWSDPAREFLAAAPDAIRDPRFARVAYGPANEIANQVANGLLAAGLRRGDRVALLCENGVEAYLTKMGIAKAGLVAFPINTMMADDLVVAMLEHCEATVAIVDSDLWAIKSGPLERAGVRPLAGIAGRNPLPADTPSFAEFIDAASPRDPDVRIHSDDIWEILCTSGTTAMPKAVMVSHTYSYTAGFSFALTYSRRLSVEWDLVTCSFLPIIYHIGDHAHVIGPMMCGGRAVLGQRPVPSQIAATVTAERVTGLWGGSPQFLEELADAVEQDPAGYDLSSVTTIVYGWSALHPDLGDRLQAITDGCEMVAIFGQTEAIACHRFWPSRWPELYRSGPAQTNYVGLPSPLLGSTVVDADGRSLRDRPGEPGEAVYRSPAITSGYYRDLPATEEAFRGGWFHSGDMCLYEEPDGMRIMVDRYKDVVKSGGENVSSIRVESILAQHPGVARAAIVGLPDDRWGEAVTAVIVRSPGYEPEESELIAFCRERLAGYETPKRVVVVDDMPLAVGGKIQKHVLREQLR